MFIKFPYLDNATRHATFTPSNAIFLKENHEYLYEEDGINHLSFVYIYHYKKFYNSDGSGMTTSNRINKKFTLRMEMFGYWIINWNFLLASRVK